MYTWIVIFCILQSKVSVTVRRVRAYWKALVHCVLFASAEWQGKRIIVDC